MTRDRLLALLKDVRDADGCHVEEAIGALKSAIDWLESTAPGCDLVFVYEPGKSGDRPEPAGPKLKLVR